MTSELTPARQARAAGVLLGQACGDALGVPYELGSAPLGERAEMVGGGLGRYAPGEWSDDTQMAVCIAEVSATGADLTSAAALDAIAERFLAWYAAGPGDVGGQTRQVLSGSTRQDGPPSRRLRAAAAEVHARTGRSAGNGALMRTAVVGLTRLGDREATAGAARAVAELTHADPVAGDSCVLWSEAVRLAVLEGRIDVVAGLDLIPAQRRDVWQSRLLAARSNPPSQFSPNGFTVTALQAALSAIEGALGRRGRTHLESALQAAVRIGDDTDTVAAVAGGLLGAAYGPAAIPLDWQRLVHGWPGARAERTYRARDLVRLALDTARGGAREGVWPDVDRLAPVAPPLPTDPVPVPHPADPEVLVGTVADLARTRELGVTAVVTLCRLGRLEVPAPGVSPEDHVEVWLVGSDDPADNPYANDALDDAAATVARLRADGKRVLLHSVGMIRRTPSVAARYAVLAGADGLSAGRRVRSALPGASGRGGLWRLATGDRRPVFSSGIRAGCTDALAPERIVPGLLNVVPVLGADEIDLLREGLGRVEMEHRWLALLEGRVLHLWRSWSGAEIYRAELTETADGGRITDLWVEQDPGVYAGSLADEPAGFVGTLRGVLSLATRLRAGWTDWGPQPGATPTPPDVTWGG